jgi:hypothetical protein
LITHSKEGKGKKTLEVKHHLILVYSQSKISPLTIYIHDTYQTLPNLVIDVFSPGQGISQNHIMMHEVIV